MIQNYKQRNLDTNSAFTCLYLSKLSSFMNRDNTLQGRRQTHGFCLLQSTLVMEPTSPLSVATAGQGREWNGWSIKLTTQLHLLHKALRLYLRGPVPRHSFNRRVSVMFCYKSHTTVCVHPTQDSSCSLHPQEIPNRHGFIRRHDIQWHQLYPEITRETFNQSVYRYSIPATHWQYIDHMPVLYSAAFLFEAL